MSLLGKLLEVSDLGRVAHLGALVVLDAVAQRLQLAEKGSLPVPIVQITAGSVGNQRGILKGTRLQRSDSLPSE